MADKEVGGLTAATTLDGSELLHVVQGSNSRKTTVSAIVGTAHSQAWSGVTGTPTTVSGYGITDAQAKNVNLTAIAALSPTSKSVIIGNGSAWTAESGATFRASVGLAIGSDVQAYDADLTALGGLAKADGNVIIGDGTTWTVESGATLRTSFGLSIGSDVQAYNATLASLAGLTLTDGDLLYSTGASALANLARGVDGQVLRLSGGMPSWANVAGTGDMVASTYDPNSVGADAFSQDNMVDGTTNKNFTAAEKTKLAGAGDMLAANNLSDLASVSDALANLGTPLTANTMLVDNAAGTAREAKTFDDVRVLLKSAPYVSTTAALKALDTSKDKVVYLTEAKREGVFTWQTGDFSSWIATDTAEAVYIKATAVAATAGAWVRVITGPIYDKWFGVKADAVINSTGNLVSGTDDTAALQRFAAFIKKNGGGHYVLDGGSRKVWPNPVAHQTFLMDIRGIAGATIEYRNGAELHAMHPAPISDETTGGDSDAIWGIIWRLEANQDITFLNPRIEQEEKLSRATSNQIGVQHFDLSYNSFASDPAWLTRPSRNIRVLGARQRGGVTGFVVHATNGTQVERFQAQNIVYEAEMENVYYGFTNQGGADTCCVKLRTDGCGRTLFIYNCKGIDADLDINNPVGTSGNINITLYADTTHRAYTKDIKVRAKFSGTVNTPTSSHSLVSHNFIYAEAGGVIGTMANVHIDLDVNLNTGSNVRAISIHKYDNTSGSVTADAASRAWQIQNLTWSGKLNGFTTTDSFDLFTGNPVGTEDFVGAGIAQCGFRNMFSLAGQNMNFEGSRVITAYGKFFFENSYFSSTQNFTNATGKYISQNTPSIV